MDLFLLIISSKPHNFIIIFLFHLKIQNIRDFFVDSANIYILILLFVFYPNDHALKTTYFCFVRCIMSNNSKLNIIGTTKPQKVIKYPNNVISSIFCWLNALNMTKPIKCNIFAFPFLLILDP